MMLLLQGQGGLPQYGLFLIMFVFMIFFIILPQRKKAKKEKAFVGNLKTGDKVVTNAGIHGKLVSINEENATCVVETMAGKLLFEKAVLSMELTERRNAK